VEDRRRRLQQPRLRRRSRRGPRPHALQGGNGAALVCPGRLVNGRMGRRGRRAWGNAAVAALA
jgi:hypothetical protein